MCDGDSMDNDIVFHRDVCDTFVSAVLSFGKSKQQ